MKVTDDIDFKHRSYRALIGNFRWSSVLISTNSVPIRYEILKFPFSILIRNKLYIFTQFSISFKLCKFCFCCGILTKVFNFVQIENIIPAWLLQYTSLYFFLLPIQAHNVDFDLLHQISMNYFEILNSLFVLLHIY